jgi:hypothetical protein
VHKEEEIKIWIPLYFIRPVKVSGISRVSHLYFYCCLEDCASLETGFENFM